MGSRAPVSQRRARAQSEAKPNSRQDKRPGQRFARAARHTIRRVWSPNNRARCAESPPQTETCAKRSRRWERRSPKVRLQSKANFFSARATESCRASLLAATATKQKKRSKSRREIETEERHDR